MSISERKGKEEWRKRGHAGRESVKRGREEERGRVERRGRGNH